MQDDGGYFLETVADLVKTVRSETMDQSELGLRVGVSRSTISAIEKGNGVNSKSLAKVLDQLGLLEDIQLAIDAQLDLIGEVRNRKTRKVREELSSDF